MSARRILLAAAVLAVAAVATTLVTGPDPVRAEVPPDAGVLVDGVGTATGTPDVLRVTVGVESAAASVGDALHGADAAVGRVLTALQAAQVAGTDVETVDVSIYPAYGNDGQRITGYTARHDLRVTLRDVAGAGAVIGAVAAAGGDAVRVQGITYALEDVAALRQQARADAFADARATAEQYARLAGRELGEVVEMREEMSPATPAPMAADAAVISAETVPLQPGTTTVSVTARVRWSLR